MIQNIFIIGVDGAGRALLDVRCTQLAEFAKQATVYTNAFTVFPPISAQAWGSLLLSVSPEKHGYTNDSIRVTPHPIDDTYPSLYRLLHQHYPQWSLGSICNWNPINVGIIEPIPGVHKATGKTDEEITQKVVDYIPTMGDGLLYVHLDDMDEAGHTHDYFTPEFYAKLPETDSRVGRMLDAIRDSGKLDNSLIIITPDHGGGDVPKKHGTLALQDMGITMVVYGPGFEAGAIKDEQASIMDVTPMILQQLDIEIPSSMEGNPL